MPYPSTENIYMVSMRDFLFNHKEERGAEGKDLCVVTLQRSAAFLRRKQRLKLNRGGWILKRNMVCC